MYELDGESSRVKWLKDDDHSSFDWFCVDLYIRNAAKHIVALPITVKAACRATTTWKSCMEMEH